jgi:predicted TIM-barrel fold metal-dependent hydrolase
MDLSSIPIIDTHTHPFDPAREDDDFRIYFNMSLWRPPASVVTDTVLTRKLIRELGKFLGAPFGASQEEIAEFRNRVYKADPKAYIQKLMKSTNIKTMLVDTGFPHEEFTGYSVDLRIFSALVGCKTHSIFRMDTSVYKIFKLLPATFEEAVDIMKKDFEKAIKVDKIVSLKSIIAYETGLEIIKHTDKEAEEAYKRYRQNKNEEDEKIIRDYFCVMGLRVAKENNMPMQFHTGLGSAPALDLRVANPILMQYLLADDEIKEVKVVITHSGYPFCTETGYMVSIFPNVYCDVTAIFPYFGVAGKKAVLELFEFAPANRIMFGADGVIIPETYWMGYTQGVKLLGDALDELVTGNWITAGEAIEFAEKILYKNAMEIYGVSI